MRTVVVAPRLPLRSSCSSNQTPVLQAATAVLPHDRLRETSCLKGGTRLRFKECIKYLNRVRDACRGVKIQKFQISKLAKMAPFSRQFARQACRLAHTVQRIFAHSVGHLLIGMPVRTHSFASETPLFSLCTFVRVARSTHTYIWTYIYILLGQRPPLILLFDRSRYIHHELITRNNPPSYATTYTDYNNATGMAIIAGARHSSAMSKCDLFVF